MKKRIAALLLAALTLCIACAVVWYARSFYPAQEEALACMASPATGVTVMEYRNRLVFEPEKATAGLVFYPGGNVDWRAYAPLMEALAQRGILCVLIRMPMSLAILDMDAADGVRTAFPQIGRWYMAGHSLGGYAAATYLSRTHADYEGLILLAAYTQTDLTGTGLDVLSIYGTEDGILNRERYAEGLPLLPEGFEEIVIDGGCHSYFGSYGMQVGDGVPTISRERQEDLTVNAVAGFIGEGTE